MKIFQSTRSPRSYLFLAAILTVSIAAADETVTETGFYKLVAVEADQNNARAILEFENGQRSLVHRGDPIGECLITEIADNGLAMACPGADLNLPLNTARIRSTSQPGHWSPDPASYQYSISGKVLKRLLTNKEQLASNFCIVPQARDGRIYGYRIDAVENSNWSSISGLAIDDIIVSVNGAPANEPAAFIRAVNTLQGIGQIDLQVERDSELLAVTFEAVQ